MKLMVNCRQAAQAQTDGLHVLEADYTFCDVQGMGRWLLRLGCLFLCLLWCSRLRYKVRTCHPQLQMVRAAACVACLNGVQYQTLREMHQLTGFVQGFAVRQHGIWTLEDFRQKA